MLPSVWGLVIKANASRSNLSRIFAHCRIECPGVIYIWLDYPKRDMIKTLPGIPQIKIIPDARIYGAIWKSAPKY